MAKFSDCNFIKKEVSKKKSQHKAVLSKSSDQIRNDCIFVTPLDEIVSLDYWLSQVANNKKYSHNKLIVYLLEIHLVIKGFTACKAFQRSFSGIQSAPVQV